MVHNAICGEEPRRSSCLFMVTSEKSLSSVCCAEPRMLRGCYRLLPSWTFTADSYQRVWRISGKEPVEVSLEHPDISSHNRLLSPSCLFLCLPLSPFFLAPFFRTYVFIGIQTMSNPNSVFLFYFSYLCVVRTYVYVYTYAHAYVCIHVYVCACVRMCTHVESKNWH